ncbi:MAG: radical SAM protein [Candidatus Omnitrophota bacterium]
MLKSKKIILINPPWVFAHERDIVLSQNLGIAYLAAFLLKHGHEVSIIDALAEGVLNHKKISAGQQISLQVGLEYESIVKRIPEDTDFIGISAPFTNNAKIVKELAHEIKAGFPDKPIILGGVYPSLTPRDAFCADIDYYVVGEGELPLLEIISGHNPEQIQGVLAYSQPVSRVRRAKIIENLDDIPYPARNKLPMHQYLSFCSPRRDRIRTVSMITSRGCPYDCTFCSIHSITGYTWRKRSSENVLAEIKLLVEEFKVQHIEFEDDNLTFEKKRMQEIVQGIIFLNNKGANISWSAPNGVRVDTLDEELLEQIKASNCIFLNLAVESGDADMLKRMNKRLNLSKVLEITRICKRLGIKTNAFFMIGYPGETERSFKKTLNFVKKLKKIGVDEFYATITRAYPGTKLFDECKEKGYIADISAGQHMFLGNEIDKNNAIKTNDFTSRDSLRRLSLFQRVTVPFYLRWWHKYYYIVKKIIPDAFIQKVKKTLGKQF